MEFFQWTDACSVGHEDRDQEHRTFLAALNALYENLHVPERELKLGQMLDELQKYADDHFQKEEAFLEDLGYADLQKQKDQHRFFRSELGYLCQFHQQAAISELRSILQFLRDWFLSHILTSDKEYARWVYHHPKSV